jgi:hypothetical protein
MLRQDLRKTFILTHTLLFYAVLYVSLVVYTVSQDSLKAAVRYGDAPETRTFVEEFLYKMVHILLNQG